MFYKNKHLRYCFIIAFIAILSPPCNIFSQSLQASLKKSDALKRIGQRESSLAFINEVIQKSDAQNLPEMHAHALAEKAAWFNYYIEYDSAIIHGQKALEFVERQNLETLLPEFLLHNGWLVLRKFDHEKSLEYCRKAKEIAQEQGRNNLAELCNTCIEDALGIYYIGALGDEYYYPVLRAYEKSVAIHKAEKDTSKYASTLTRYIDLYRLKGHADSVKILLKELEGIFTDFKDYRLESTYYSLQSIYAYFENDFDAVYRNLRKAQEKSRQLGLDRLTQHYYFRLHDYYKGLKQYDQSIQMLDSARATYHTDHMHAHGLDLYYYVYKDAGNTEKALEFLEAWHNDEDWKRKNEKVELITEWQTKYKTQEKEALIEKGRIQRFWLLAFLISFLVFILMLVFAYRKQKKNAFQLAQQNQIIEQQANELQQLDKIKSRFFANVSHELRTPLTLLLGPINSILKKADVNNRTFTLLKLAQINGQQLLKLINSILDLSRLESGKLELKEEAIVIYPLIKRIVSQFESNAQLQEIELVIDYQLDPYLKVHLDVSKFETILNNLLSNALKFTPKGGRIQVICNDLGNKMELQVADTGAGIHPDDLPHVFNRFFQTKQANAPTEGGSGIGLALSLELAKLFNGNLSVESKLKKGSTFFFTLPKKEVLGFIEEKEISIPVKLTKEEKAIINKSTSSKQQANILVVEDNPSLRQYLQLILNEQYHITTAENGQVALEHLEKNNNFQLIISDVMMPVMDGYQLLEKLKSDDRWRHLPVVMLTARAELQDKLKALRIGVDDYLLKPFEEEELLIRLNNLIANHKLRQHQKEEEVLRTDATPPFSKADAEWLEKVELSVQSAIDNPQFTLLQLSQMLFISERQMSRKIKTLTGLTPNKYIREIKLQHARTLLESRKYVTVSEVSQAVGFSKTEYFSQLYKERFGKLPSAYIF